MMMFINNIYIVFKDKNLRLPIIFWFTAVLFFAFQFTVKLSVGIFQEEIIDKYNLTVHEFGYLAGYYYVGYALMQIPIGLLLDRFNVAYISCTFMLLCAIGLLTFVVGDNVYYLLIGRAIIGMGAAAGFLTVTKIINTYFPQQYRSMMMGISLALGVIGAMLNVPLKYFYYAFNYSATFIALSVICALISILNFFVGMSCNRRVGHTEKIQHSVTIVQLIKLSFNRLTLIVGICSGLMCGAQSAFVDAWSIPFFMNIYHFTENQSLFIVSSIFFGLGIGGPVLSYWHNKVKFTSTLIFITGTLMSAILIILLLLPYIPYRIAILLMALLGGLGAYQTVMFIFVANLLPYQALGASIAVINCIYMIFGHFFHYYISYRIGISWDGSLSVNGDHIYNINDFIGSFIIIPICNSLGQMIFIFVEYHVRKGGIFNSNISDSNDIAIER